MGAPPCDGSLDDFSLDDVSQVGESSQSVRRPGIPPPDDALLGGSARDGLTHRTPPPEVPPRDLPPHLAPSPETMPSGATSPGVAVFAAGRAARRPRRATSEDAWWADDPLSGDSSPDEPRSDVPPSDEPPFRTTPSDTARSDHPGPDVREPSGETDRDPAPTPLSLPARWAGAVGDRMPVSLKAFRLGVDARVVAAVAVLAVLAIVFAGVTWWQGRPRSVAVPPGDVAASTGWSLTATPSTSGGTSADASGTASASSATPGPVSVHVVGRVARPGVLVLPAGARVDDALKAAGGVLPGTDLSVLNLARVVGDGEQIPVGVPGATAIPYGGDGAGTSSGVKSAQAVVDLNTATAEQLETLPGIGPVMARSIVEWRQENGRFTSVDQLRDVRGIGESRFADLRAKVRV